MTSIGNSEIAPCGQVFITNQPDPAILEACHRPHAHVEDRIRSAKATGLRNLPLWGLPPTTPG